MSKHDISKVNTNRRGWLVNLLTLPVVASIFPGKADGNTKVSLNDKSHDCRCISVDELVDIKNISFNENNDKYYFSVRSNHLQSGYFIAIKNTDYIDDGGVFIRIDEFYGWLRIYSGNVQAEWFGVIGDNIDCGLEIVHSIKYIAYNGGVLEFSTGVFSLGKHRVLLTKEDVKSSFSIIGKGEKTVFSFENIDPPGNDKTTWVKEPMLFSFIGRDSEDFLPSILLKDFSLDYSRQRNKGGHDLDSLEITHPSPYSVGTNAIYFYYAYSPVIENIYINNVYGNGIVIKKSFYPQIKNCRGNNVSAGNVVSPDGNMAKDSDGGFCFLWSCFSGLVENCIAWNNRVFQAKYSSLDNAVEMQGTLCGYIGFWAEYSLTRDNDIPPPMLTWLRKKDPDSNTLSNGIIFRNNVVYGYTIGIKTESYVDAIIEGNVVLNCYLPIFASGTRCTISSNWVDMLQCSNIKCPQGGLEFKRSYLGGATWAKNNDTNMSILIEKNYVKSVQYPIFLSNRNNLVVKNNYFLITNKGKLFDSRDNKIVTGLSLIENTFIIDSLYQSSDSHITYNNNVRFFGNNFINKSSNLCRVFLGNSREQYFSFHNNNFNGFFQIVSNSYLHFEENDIVISQVNKPFLITKSSGVEFKRNILNLGMLSNVPLVDLFSNDVKIVKNKITVSSVTDDNTPLFRFNDNNVYNVTIDNTMLTINGAKLNLATFNNVHYMKLTGNSSNIALQVNIYDRGFGPFYVKGNSFKTINGIEDYDPNSINNISPLYSASVGEVVYSLKPQLGSNIGIIYTENGWHKFGTL
ncbi:hypothetical protein IB240_14105 [Raoultella sp. RLT01]|uniref:hypothetical protein n=1 Tax=Raoultella sp. RLT01 TaxID=2769256 RepID=UPI00177E5923|nr:hypothetical protein [Raoultella sp. RLT01]MBD9719534.1 hypothetical protein [Raoultella sp. RLT01]